MAVTLDVRLADSMELKDFVEWVDKTHDDALSLNDLIEAAPNLARLANNRQFIEEFLIGQLKDIVDFQTDNYYTAQTLILGGVPRKFYVRANVWVPEHLLHEVNSEGERRFFSYDYPHDHNFDFLTIGYLGSGYETDIYEYAGSRVAGAIGEKVELEFLESTSLPEHKLMAYRASRDIHVQKLPREFSISLNLMAPAAAPPREQYAFDVDRGKISNIICGSILTETMLIEAAGHLCNDNISDVLLTMAASHASSRIRAASRQALGIRWPELADSMPPFLP